jgi:hypothetical protein
MRIDLVARAAATAPVADKYRLRPFDWAKRATCIHLARDQLVAMGHAPPPIPVFRSALGARRALHKAGFADVAALLDSLLPRIPPASMVVGDLALMAGEGGLDGIVVSAGGKVMGWHESDPSGLMNLIGIDYLAAWRT